MTRWHSAPQRRVYNMTVPQTSRPLSEMTPLIAVCLLNVRYSLTLCYPSSCARAKGESTLHGRSISQAQILLWVIRSIPLPKPLPNEGLFSLILRTNPRKERPVESTARLR